MKKISFPLIDDDSLSLNCARSGFTCDKCRLRKHFIKESELQRRSMIDVADELIEKDKFGSSCYLLFKYYKKQYLIAEWSKL